MKALLQFNKFKVLEIQYRSALGATNFDEEISPKFGIQLGLNENDIKEAILKLEVEIGENTEEDYLKVSIAGYFTFETEEEVDEEVIYNFYERNGTAILFPYLRSIVSDLTSKGSDSPIILPTINILAMLDARKESEETATDLDASGDFVEIEEDPIVVIKEEKSSKRSS